jgi:hypothetical protein
MSRVRAMTAAGAMLATALCASAWGAQTLALHPLKVDAQLTHTGTVDDRYVLFGRDGGVVTVRDTERHAVVPMPTVAGCRLVTIGAARTLFLCPPGPQDGRIRLVTTTFAGADARTVALEPAQALSPTALGRHWIRLESMRSGAAPLYVSWRSGQQRTAAGTRDLDSAALLRVPTRSPPNPRSLPRPRPTSPVRVLEGTRRTVLSRCARGCRGGELVAGHVYWSEQGRLHVSSVATGRTTSAPIDVDDTTIVYSSAYEVGLYRPHATPRYVYARLPA